MRLSITALALLLVLTLAVPARADALSLPPEVTAALPGASAHGKGALTFLWYEAYTATLWTNGSWSADKPYALSLVYDMDFTADEIVERSIDEMERAHDKADVAAVKADLKKSMTDVTQGDRLTGVFLPPNTTRFYHNGQLVNIVESKAFADMFFSIWLGPKTSEPSLRAALLAEGGS